MPQGFYVVARQHHRTIHLCGPFEQRSAAVAMVEPVRAAAALEPDDRFRTAIFTVAKLTVPPGEKLPAGRLRMENLPAAILDVILR